MSRVDVAIAHHLRAWRLVPDGGPIETPSSVLVPVHRNDGMPLMLKVATVDEEVAGGRLMVWWNGRGAARVFAHEEEAILLERATGIRSLETMARSGPRGDESALRVLCATGMRLHGIDGAPPDGLVPLDRWFRELLDVEADADPFLGRAARLARVLLETQTERVVLHGDLHHGNVLDFGAARAPGTRDGWRAIDPKALFGDRAFDYANALCNPDAATALAPGRLERRVEIITSVTGIERERMLRWAIAWSALSSIWRLNDGEKAGHAIDVGRAAERLLRPPSE